MRTVKIFAWAGAGLTRHEVTEWMEIQIPEYIPEDSLMEWNFIDHHVKDWKDRMIKSFWEYEANMTPITENP